MKKIKKFAVKRPRLLYHLRRNAFTRRLMLALDPTMFVNLHDIKFRVCLKLFRHSGYVFGSSEVEPVMHQLFREQCEVRTPLTFVDIGANIGVYSWMAKSVRSDALIMAVEPDQGNFACLTRTVQRNKLAAVNLIGKAISNRQGFETLRVDRLSGQTGSIIPWFANSDEILYGDKQICAHSVECTSIDDLLSDGLPNLIKIDIEGAEVLALQGARHCILRAKPTIFVEVAECNMFSVRSICESLNYRMREIIECTPGPSRNFLLTPKVPTMERICHSSNLKDLD